MSVTRSRSASGVVELTAMGLRVDATFANAAILDYVQAGGLDPEPVGCVENLLVIGVLASRTGRDQVFADETRRAQEALRVMLTTEAEQYIRAAIQHAAGKNGDKGALIPEMERVVGDGVKAFEAVAQGLAGKLNGTGEASLPQVLEQRTRKAVGEVVETIVKNAFASGGPLATVLVNNVQAMKDLREDLLRLHELVLRTITAGEQIDPAQAGRDWQPATLEDIARLTHITGDTLEETGDVPGHGRAKNGDGVLHLAGNDRDSGPKVAIETRTGAQVVSLAELRKAKMNRHADAALLLTEQVSALPKDARPLGFRIYTDDAIVVLHYKREDSEAGVLIATAVQVARHMAQLRLGASEARIDDDVVRTVIGRLETTVGRLKPLRGSLTGIETEVTRIRGYVQDIEREARSALGELAGLTRAS
jgi:hypothetical protein